MQNGFARLNRTFHSGDKITLVLPMKPAVSHWPDNGIGVEHGPLVYSLPIKEDWSPVVVPKYSTADFPDWNATPATPWNYGLAIDEAKLDSEILVERKTGVEDPCVNPHIT